MSKITITFPHMYLLCDIHKNPRFHSDLSQAHQLLYKDLAALKLVEIYEWRVFTTTEGNLLVMDMSLPLKQYAEIFS